METTNPISSFPIRAPCSLFSLKPFKLKLDRSNCVCQNVTNANIKIVPISPKPRSGHIIVCDDINMYSFGGHDSSVNPSDEEVFSTDRVMSQNRSLFSELWKYNIAMKRWTKLNVEDEPNIFALRLHAVLMSGQLLMVYGGIGRNYLFTCDLHNDTIPLRFNHASENWPRAKLGQTIVQVNNYLYVIGDNTGFGFEKHTCDIHRLNVKDGVWENVYTCTGSENEPPGRYRYETAFDGNKIYVLGGVKAREPFDFEIIFAFNLSSKEWEKIVTRPDDKSRNKYPIPRRCYSSVQYEEYAYIIGGFNGRSILKDIWRINLNTMKWEKFTKFTADKGLCFHSSCVTSNGKLFTFGGIVPSDIKSIKSALVHSAWLCVPKLKDICWEAVTYYQPNLDSLSTKQLHLLGLPDEYIRRLDLQN